MIGTLVVTKNRTATAKRKPKNWKKSYRTEKRIKNGWRGDKNKTNQNV